MFIYITLGLHILIRRAEDFSCFLNGVNLSQGNINILDEYA